MPKAIFFKILDYNTKMGLVNVLCDGQAIEFTNAAILIQD
jgi:hypothetical protein